MFVYLYILTLSGHWKAQRGRGFAEISTAAPIYLAIDSGTRLPKYYTRQYSQVAHYNRCVRPSVGRSVHPLSVSKNCPITLEPHDLFSQIIYKFAGNNIFAFLTFFLVPDTD